MVHHVGGYRRQSLGQKLRERELFPYGDYAPPGPYIGGWSDEGESVRYLVMLLKENKVRAKTSYSPYEGHRVLAIHQDDVLRAITVLKRQDPYIAGVYQEKVDRAARFSLRTGYTVR